MSYQFKNLISIKMIIMVCFLLGCNATDKENKQAQSFKVDDINLDHFNHLYKEIVINGDSMAIVHIYSEAPDYVYNIEPKEGFTCVDDVARSIVMLSEYYLHIDDATTVLYQIKMMVNFILHMQNENGYFNNFIWNDFAINTTYQTTVAELNWWSLRALWAVETALPLIKDDMKLSTKMKMSSTQLVNNLIRDLGALPFEIDEVNTISCPNWLPQKYGADQAAILIIGLLPYYARTNDEIALDLIDRMAKGIMLMQKGDSDIHPYGAFLSWENTWHAWGNSQAYALLKAGQLLENQIYINSGLREVDHFYPYLIKNGYMSSFEIKKKDASFVEIQKNDFSQIAYGIRPMIWAAVQAYDITGDEKYWVMSNELKSWFFKKNKANALMYDCQTGRGFDGIISIEEINKNAGAESTLESLMSMIKMHR